jgi:dTDP-L-rhamnose 4-epimerase
MATRRALVTGGAGFIAGHLGRALVAEGWSVTALASLLEQVHPAGERPASLDPAVDLVVADVRDAAAVREVVATGPWDLVVHLAAETGTGQSLTESTRHASVNVVGTTTLLDALTAEGSAPGHVLLASSRAVYGEGQWRDPAGRVTSPGQRTHQQLAQAAWDPTGERGELLQPLPQAAATTVPAPTSVYGATKLAQEHVLGAWCGARGVPLSVLRLQNVFGPGQSLTNAYTGIVVLFSRLAREGRAIPLYEDGAVVRDFVHVGDVVDALLAAVRQPPRVRRTTDVGSGRATTILELATALASRHGAPAPVLTGQFRDGDVRAAWADVDAIAAELDWRPSRTLEQGLDDLESWIASLGDTPG